MLLHFTGVGAEKVREMAVCKTNKERREAATTYFINQAIKLLRSIAATQPDAHKMRHEGSRRGTKDLGLTQEFLDEGPDKRLRPRHVCGGCGEWKSGRLLCAQWKVKSSQVVRFISTHTIQYIFAVVKFKAAERCCRWVAS